MGLMKAPNPQTGNWEGVDALAINDDKGERVTVARIKATEAKLAAIEAGGISGDIDAGLFTDTATVGENIDGGTF